MRTYRITLDFEYFDEDYNGDFLADIDSVGTALNDPDIVACMIEQAGLDPICIGRAVGYIEEETRR